MYSLYIQCSHAFECDFYDHIVDNVPEEHTESIISALVWAMEQPAPAEADMSRIYKCILFKDNDNIMSFEVIFTPK